MDLTKYLPSVYHTPEWRKVIKNTYGYQSHYFVKSRADEIVGLMPLFEVRSFISGRHLTSIPFSHHVDIFYETDRTLHDFVDEAQKLACQNNCGYIEIRGSAHELRNVGFQVSEHNWISKLDLRLPQDKLWNNLHGSTRRNIKKAAKHNLTIHHGTNKVDYDIFYKLVLETRRYQGVPAYPAQLFAELQQMPQAELYLVCQNEKILAGIVLLGYGKSVVYGYGASVKNPDILRMRPNDLLFWHMICEMKTRGYETFDFGTTPINNSNLLRFKENWGCRSEKIGYAYWLNTAEHVPIFERNSVKMEFAGAIIRRMPLWVVRLISDFLIKQLG